MLGLQNKTTVRAQSPFPILQKYNSSEKFSRINDKLKFYFKEIRYYKRGYRPRENFSKSNLISFIFKASDTLRF